MLKKITDNYFKREQVFAYIAEMERMVNKYGWHDMIVHPYPNCPLKVTKILSDLRDYDNCTKGSKEYLVTLANGLADILNKWEEYENQPLVSVRVLKTGVVKMLREELANDMIAAGLCERG